MTSVSSVGALDLCYEIKENVMKENIPFLNILNNESNCYIEQNIKTKQNWHNLFGLSKMKSARFFEKFISPKEPIRRFLSKRVRLLLYTVYYLYLYIIFYKNMVNKIQTITILQT